MQETAATTGTSILSLGIIINVFGTLAGVLAVIIVLRTLAKVGGQVGAAFTLTLFGMVFQTTALFYDILAYLKITPEITINTPFGSIMNHTIHETLMVTGIIFFVLAARQFAKLSL